jgi:protoporphyrinogen oxidase
VDSFLSRRFGDAFARTLGSALVHGIYAADSRVLSVRAAFPVLRESEARGKGSVLWGELGPPAWFGVGGRRKAQVKAEAEEEEEGEGVDREWEAHFRTSAALFSFREGMETLVRALVEALRGFPNVTLRCGAVVRGIDTTTDEDCGNGDRDHDDRRLSFQVRVPSFRVFFFGGGGRWVADVMKRSFSFPFVTHGYL